MFLGPPSVKCATIFFETAFDRLCHTNRPLLAAVVLVVVAAHGFWEGAAIIFTGRAHAAGVLVLALLAIGARLRGGWRRNNSSIRG